MQKRITGRLGPAAAVGKMTLMDFESFFDTDPSLSGRNLRSRTIARDVLVFGKTQRETAEDNDVDPYYVYSLMKNVSRAYKRVTLPAGYVILENLVLPAAEAESVLKLSQATKSALKKTLNGGVA